MLTNYFVDMMTAICVSYDTQQEDTMTDPTRTTYQGLTEAYDFFNTRLFGGRLPRCLITMQRQKGAYGYFAGGRFGSEDGTEVTDEIALNPSHFRSRTTEQSLSTLVHEMTHLEQHHFGKPSRNGYHNKQWAGMMHAVGLIPSTTGAPGGKETGQKVSHYMLAGGAFVMACGKLVEQGFAVRYVELWGDPEARKKKAASKTKYTCPECGMNAWGKPAINLICGHCDEAMQADLAEPEPD
jgi:predicted SprT family Zn-dependent metalloprotease